jgi:hypothetical protein
MVNESVLIMSSFQTFLTDLLPQMLQNLPVVMLINRLAWRNKFLMNDALTVKKDHQHALGVQLKLALLSLAVESMGFSTEKSDIWFLVCNSTPSSCVLL